MIRFREAKQKFHCTKCDSILKEAAAFVKLPEIDLSAHFLPPLILQSEMRSMQMLSSCVALSNDLGFCSTTQVQRKSIRANNPLCD